MTCLLQEQCGSTAEEPRAGQAAEARLLGTTVASCSHFSPFLRPSVAVSLTLPACSIGKILAMGAPA